MNTQHEKTQKKSDKLKGILAMIGSVLYLSLVIWLCIAYPSAATRFFKILGITLLIAAAIGLVLIIIGIIRMAISYRRFKKMVNAEIDVLMHGPMPGPEIVFPKMKMPDFSNLQMDGVAASEAKAKERPEEKQEEEATPKITLDDVKGIDEIKPDLNRIIDSLKNPEKYKVMGAKTPKGLMLYGPPGTGKTLIAKAIAGTAGVNFLQGSASDFMEKYVGVGAQRVRTLYQKAREMAPCIVFIDEIDSIGAQRGNDNNGERDQTLNAFLTELDGFSSTEGVVTICATNRLDLLDSALLRPGRFDLQLAVPLPTKKGRLDILNLYAKNKKLASSVNLEALAKKTAGFAGADLENILNETMHIAIEKNKAEADDSDIQDALFKIIMKGNKRKNDDAKPETLKLIAWHEAGHTLAHKLLTNDSIPSVTIIGSTSGAGGVTFIDHEEGIIRSKKDLRNEILTSYAGRAAEEILLGSSDNVTIGASQDIRQATHIIHNYLNAYGMGNNGMIDAQLLGVKEPSVAEAAALAKECYSEVLNLLSENKETLSKLADALLEKEELIEEEIDAIIGIASV